MIIDSHQHVIKDIIHQKKYNRECGVDKVILFPTVVHPETANSRTELVREMGRLRQILSGEINPVEARIAAIEELKTAIGSDPAFFTGFAPCPFGLDLEKTGEWIEERIIGNGFRGIGELTFGTGNAGGIENIFRYLHDRRKDLPVWIHTFNPLALGDIADITRLAAHYDSVKVILGHGGGSNWLETIDLVKENSNIYMDISASFTIFSIKYISAELPDRCLFSSDFPYGDPLLGIQQVEYLIKDKAVRENILGLNIKRLLNL